MYTKTGQHRATGKNLSLWSWWTLKLWNLHVWCFDDSTCRTKASGAVFFEIKNHLITHGLVEMKCKIWRNWWNGYNLQTTKIHISFLDDLTPSRNDFQKIKSIQFIPRWKCLAQEPAPPPGLGPLLGGKNRWAPSQTIGGLGGCFLSKFQVAPGFRFLVFGWCTVSLNDSKPLIVYTPR